MLKQQTNHSYYCSDTNYYSDEASLEFDSVTEFLDGFEDADVDMNLCFRFDIGERNVDSDIEDYGKLYAEFFKNKFKKW